MGDELARLRAAGFEWRPGMQAANGYRCVEVVPYGTRWPVGINTELRDVGPMPDGSEPDLTDIPTLFALVEQVRERLPVGETRRRLAHAVSLWVRRPFSTGPLAAAIVEAFEAVAQQAPASTTGQE